MFEDPTFVTISADSTTFTIAKSGRYRVVVKVNGISASANSDHIALHLNGTSIARSMVGLNTGSQIAAHIHEVLDLHSADTFQVYQQFDGGSLGSAMDNTLFFEPMDVLEAEPEVKQEAESLSDNRITPQQRLCARSMPTCLRCFKPFSDEDASVPKSLHCGHVLCSTCIIECTTLQGSQCSLCTIVSTEAANTEAQIIEIAKTARECATKLLTGENEAKGDIPAVLPKCFHCQEAVATVKSKRDDIVLCDRCLELNPVVRMRGVESLDAWEPSVMCSTHRTRPAEFFCYQDQILICVECAAFEHKSHFVEKALKAFQSLITSNLDALAKNNMAQQDEVENILSKLNESREQLLSSASILPQIKLYFKQAHASLVQREQTTLQSLADHINRNQEDLRDVQLGLLNSSSELTKVSDDLNKFKKSKEPVGEKTAIAFLASLENCQSYKRSNFAQNLKVAWQAAPFDPPEQKLQLPTLSWELNSRRLLDFEPALVMKQTTVAQTTPGYKSWNQQLFISDNDFEFKDAMCVAKKAGWYRVAARVNGSCSAANADCLALHVDQTAVAQSFAGLNTGHQIAVSLHQLVSLQAGQNIQIYQSMDGGNLAQLVDNFTYVEAVSPKVCHYSTTIQQANEAKKTWNTVVQEDKSVCICTEEHTFTVQKEGLFRIVVNVNGTCAAANIDQIGIMVKGVTIHRAMAGVATGHNKGVHLHELVSLRNGDSFQISQSFSGSNLGSVQDNSLFIEIANPLISRYTSATAQTAGFFVWHAVSETKSWVELSANGHTFTVNSAGFYRIVAKINGTSRGANKDHIALYVDNKIAAHALVGLNTGHQIVAHLHEVLRLKPQQTLQVYQEFSDQSLGDSAFNSLYVEKL